MPVDSSLVLQGNVGDLVRQGRKSLASGGGIHNWKKRDGEALLAERRAELLRWLKADRERKKTR